MDRKLDVGDTLSQAFSTYGAQAGVLLPVAFGLFLVVAVIDALITGSLILFPLGLAVSVIAGTLYQGMVVNLVRDVQDGRRDASAAELLRSAAPVIAPLIGAGLLAGLAIGVGFLLLVVPGLILLTIWAVIAPVIVIERTGIFKAFGRSRELVRGNGWRVFGVIFIVFLITAFVGLLLGALGASIASGTGGRIVFNVIASTLTAPIGALTAAVIYFRLREIHGGGEAPSADFENPPALQS